MGATGIEEEEEEEEEEEVVYICYPYGLMPKYTDISTFTFHECKYYD
jgi:hypothetical protein